MLFFNFNKFRMNEKIEILFLSFGGKQQTVALMPFA
jgi:hypothetical protein